MNGYLFALLDAKDGTTQAVYIPRRDVKHVRQEVLMNEQGYVAKVYAHTYSSKFVVAAKQFGIDEDLAAGEWAVKAQRVIAQKLWGDELELVSLLD